MELAIRKDCFAYTKPGKTMVEHCMALNDFECLKGECNFYCKASEFDFKKLESDMATYARTHTDKGTKKYSVTVEEILDVIDN